MHFHSYGFYSPAVQQFLPLRLRESDVLGRVLTTHALSFLIPHSRLTSEAFNINTSAPNVGLLCMSR